MTDSRVFAYVTCEVSVILFLPHLSYLTQLTTNRRGGVSPYKADCINLKYWFTGIVSGNISIKLLNSSVKWWLHKLFPVPTSRPRGLKILQSSIYPLACELTAYIWATFPPCLTTTYTWPYFTNTPQLVNSRGIKSRFNSAALQSAPVSL